MGFGDFLSSALTVGTQAAGAHEKGLAEGQNRETQDLLQRIQLARQQNADALSRQLTQSTIGRNNAQAAKDLAPAAPPKPPQTISPGQGVRQPDGTYKVIIPRERSVGEELRGQKQQTDEDAAEAWWNSDSGGQTNAAASQMFKNIRAAHPDWKPQRIMVAVKQAVESNAKGANLGARTNKIETGGFAPSAGGSAPASGPAFPRPAGWSDEKWNQYLKDTGQAP